MTAWAGLLPDDVSLVDCRMAAAPPQLFPQEERLVTAAGAGRRHEFAWGRACSRKALRRLGFPAGAIGRGSQRQPLWPAGIVGSISHSGGYCAAAVASAGTYAAVGIDVEIRGAPLSDGVIRKITTAAERDWLAAGPPDAARMVFSAKESVYKAWFAMTGRWLGFADVSIRVRAGTFEVRFARHRGRAVELFAQSVGRFSIDDEFVRTAVSIARWRIADADARLP